MAPLSLPLAHSKFSLNSAAVAGFFGGKEAISAMATVNLYRGRRWLGWFNSPGSYTIAKRFGRMANSRFWDGLFPGPNDPPAVSFGLDGKRGPQYIAALSGTEMPTQHLAYLTMERSKGLKVVEIIGRTTKPCDVAYLAMKNVDYEAPVKRLPLQDALLGLIPITVSVVTCIMCALVEDWYSFSMILLGIVSSGLTSVVIGKGKLVIKSVKNPALGAPPGHGILKGEDEVVVIKGEERDVNAITKGEFDLKTPPTSTDEEKGVVHLHHDIGICSLLLMLQFLLQLLLIPQGSLFGQIMFVTSLGVSWVYNSYLSSLEKEKIQTNLLFETLGAPTMLRFRTGTRTTMAVFVCLLLFHGIERSSLQTDKDRRVRILRSCLANDTATWKRWTNKVVNQLLNIDYESKALHYLKEDDEDRALPESQRPLLKQLLEDAVSAFEGYFKICDSLPSDGSSRPKRASEKSIE